MQLPPQPFTRWDAIAGIVASVLLLYVVWAQAIIGGGEALVIACVAILMITHRLLNRCD